MTPHSLINGALLAVLLLCMFGSYFGWGWALLGAGAAITLTRPWLPEKGGQVTIRR